jgi:cephalosporin hydroxylase
MSLVGLADNTRTDKNTVHSYLPLYQTLLESKKDSAKNVLEVGIYHGGSIKLWADFFPNATVHALDIIPIENIWDQLKNKDRIQLYPSTDAYDEVTFKTNFLDKQIRCDFMLDDGPHTLQSMKDFIRLYSQIMTDDGILIIEDVQAWSWIETLTAATPASLRSYIKTYDLRQNKGRYDDIVFTIDKRNV